MPSDPVANGPAAAAGIAWGDPPPIKKSQSALTPEIQAQLRARPGEWARVRTFKAPASASTIAFAIRKRGVAGPDFEMTTRRVDGGSALWARYVGQS